MLKPILKAMANWLWLELTEGWRSWWPRQAAAHSSEPQSPEPILGRNREGVP